MSQFRNLVFEGGGVKGAAFAGVLEVLEEENILQEIERVAGTSAGAITAAVVAVGATSEDVADIVANTNFKAFMDDSLGVVRDAKRLLQNYGWYKGDAFGDWMKRLIYSFTGDTNLTFRGLAELKERDPKRYRDLYIVGTNLSMQMAQIYSKEHTPDMPIWRAIRVSMSIPLFFAAVREEDGVFVDGGVTWNYPIDLFDDKKYLSKKSRAFETPEYTRYSDNHIYNKETLGFRVDTEDEIKANKESWRRPPKEIEDISDYVKILMGFIMDTINKVHLHENDWHRTIFIDVAGVRTTDFDLPESKKEMLISNGRKAAKKYLKWFNDPASKPINRV